jgi:hypothetical protein
MTKPGTLLHLHTVSPVHRSSGLVHERAVALGHSARIRLMD